MAVSSPIIDQEITTLEITKEVVTSIDQEKGLLVDLVDLEIELLVEIEKLPERMVINQATT